MTASPRFLRQVNLPGLATIAALVALWQAADALGFIAYKFVTPPSGIAAAVADVVSSGDLWPYLSHTVLAALSAWAIAMVVGVALGLLIGLVPWVWRWSMASVQILRTLPAVALVPVVLLIVGFSIKAEILVAAYVALWPVVVSTAVAIGNASPQLRDVSRSLRLSRRETLQKVLLPSAWPEIAVVARLALSLSLVLVVVTEMVGNPAGLGYALVSTQQALQPDQMWAYLILIGVLGVAMQSLLALGSRHVLPGLAPRLSTGGR